MQKVRITHLTNISFVCHLMISTLQQLSNLFWYVSVFLTFTVINVIKTLPTDRFICCLISFAETRYLICQFYTVWMYLISLMLQNQMIVSLFIITDGRGQVLVLMISFWGPWQLWLHWHLALTDESWDNSSSEKLSPW